MTLLEALTKRTLLADGAMGTQLQSAGLELGECGEAWCLDHPDRVRAIHRTYVDAGADLLITNTFGGSRLALTRHGESRITSINRAAALLAREAFGGRQGWVIGDVGPFGGILAPLGENEPAAVADALLEQCTALVEAGVDAILIETQTALEELEIGVEAARKAGATTVIGSLAYDRMHASTDVRTMMGVSPEEAMERLVALDVDVLGMNCGAKVGIALAATVVRRYRALSDLPILAQPNAGTPELRDGVMVYLEEPSDMAAQVPALVASGAAIVGGCCGTTPAHIAAFKHILDLIR